MSHPEHPEHHDAWRRRLAPLGEDHHPDPSLKAGTVARLRRSGLIQPGLLHRRWRIAAQLAAAVLLVMAGAMVGSRRSSPPGTVPSGPRFVLLLVEDSSFTPGMDHQRLVGEYSAWAQGLADRGQLVLGEALEDRDVTLGPGMLAGPGRITGFFIVAAGGIEEAQAIARSCPHLGYGGSIVVRPVEPT